MAVTRKFPVSFPLGGEDRRGGYAQQHRPYTTPRAINVRGVGPLERRGRGGSRPGLSKYVSDDFGAVITGMAQITYVGNDGSYNQDLIVIVDGVFKILSGVTVTTTEAKLLWPDGQEILWEDGQNIIYASTIASVNPLGNSNAFDMAEYQGKLYVADSTLKVYDPLTGALNVMSADHVNQRAADEPLPQNQPLIEIYKERIVLAGENHMFYMSAQGEPGNWVAGALSDLPTKAVFGHVGDSGRFGEKIQALVNYKDRHLVIGCTDSLWMISGDLGSNGVKKNVSDKVGILAANASAVTPSGKMYFLGRNGLNTWQVGSDSEPEQLSKRRVPDLLFNVDETSNDILMYYDHDSKGINLFITPNSGVGTHWWIDIESNALWPMKLQDTHQPLAVSSLNIDGFSRVLLGCKDGYIRRFDNASATDDGSNIESDLLLGPFHVSGDDAMEGILNEIHGILAAGSADVTWKVIMGDSAEGVVDKAETALDGDGTTGVAATGTWSAGRNRIVRPRARGSWAVLWLASTSKWSYEAVKLIGFRLGRVRQTWV